MKKRSSRKPAKIKLLHTQKAELKENTYYKIRIQKNRKNNHLYLIAQNDSQKVMNDDYYIDLPKKEAKSVKQLFNGDYSSIVDSISIHDNKLVLLNPNYKGSSSRNEAPLKGITQENWTEKASDEPAKLQNINHTIG